MHIIVTNPDKIIDQKEIDSYVKMAQDKYGDNLVGLKIDVEDNDEVTLTYTLANNVPFERIRRITGYLVGTLDRFNNAKKAEVNDRVTHATK